MGQIQRFVEEAQRLRRGLLLAAAAAAVAAVLIVAAKAAALVTNLAAVITGSTEGCTTVLGEGLGRLTPAEGFCGLIVAAVLRERIGAH